MLKIGNITFDHFPIFLAPMEDITNPSFRVICKQMGADVVYTEFISSEGLIRDAVKSTRKLLFSEEERPIGIQIFGHNEDSMRRAAEVATEARPDLIDINFGCPIRKVASKGGGAGLLNNLPMMVKITQAVVKSTSIPVTVKTRLGWDELHKNIVEIAEQLQDCGIQAITIHGRTKAQMYKGVADWTLIREVKNNPRMKIPIIGNGDVDSAQKALKMKQEYGVDGIMIGRASIGNPWIFREVKVCLQDGTLPPPPSFSERIEICKRHFINSLQTKGDQKTVFEMRKHYSSYFKGLADFKKHRLQLLTLTQPEEVLQMLDSFNILPY